MDNRYHFHLPCHTVVFPSENHMISCMELVTRMFMSSSRASLVSLCVNISVVIKFPDNTTNVIIILLYMHTAHDKINNAITWNVKLIVPVPSPQA